MRQVFDIHQLSGKLGIHPERLQEWLQLNGLLTSDEATPEQEQRPDRLVPLYRLAPPTTLPLAPSFGQSVRYQGRRSATGSSRTPNSLRHLQQFNNK